MGALYINRKTRGLKVQIQIIIRYLIHFDIRKASIGKGPLQTLQYDPVHSSEMCAAGDRESRSLCQSLCHFLPRQAKCLANLQ